MAAIEIQQINRVTDALKDDVILISRLGALHTITMAALQQAVFNVPEVLPNITADITIPKVAGATFNKEVGVDFSAAATAGLAGITVTLGEYIAALPNNPNPTVPFSDGDTISLYRLGNSTLTLTIQYRSPTGAVKVIATSAAAEVMHTLVHYKGIWYAK